jgi:DNA excision repair protein ERCC-2
MEKTLKEIKALLKKRKTEDPEGRKFFCLGLTAKKNLCVQKHIDEWRTNSNVESECKKRTAEWVRSSTKSEPELCEFYENFRNLNEVFQKVDDHQVFTIEDLRVYGKQKVQCPYYSAREGLKIADIIVFNYLYLIDPQISPNFLKELSKDTIVVFDEAHNIDDICIESYTLKVNRQLLNSAEDNVKKLEHKLELIKTTTTQNFEAEVHKMIAKLKEKHEMQFKHLQTE